MKDKTLLKLSLTAAITGILSLFIISQVTELDEIALSDAENNIGRTVRVSGRVAYARQDNKTLFLTLEDGKDRLSIVFFKDSEHIRIGENDIVQVQGDIDEYKGNTEIIASEIKIINKQ